MSTTALDVKSRPIRWRPRVRTVWLQLTSACNLSCRYCSAHANNGAAARLSDDQLEGVLSALARQPRTTVIFSGGEPSLDRRLPTLLRRSALHHGHHTGMATNAVRLSDELLRALVACEAFVQVSLDTLRPETFHALTGRDALDDVLRNLDRLLEAGVETTLSLVATRRNVADLPAAVELALARGIPHLHVGQLVISPEAEGFEELGGVGVRELWDLLYPLQLRHHRQLSIDLVEDFLLPLASGVAHHTYCHALDGRGLEITSRGRVTLCAALPRAAYSCGNLHRESFEQILTRFEAGRACQAVDYDALTQCHSCPARPLCGCGCRAIPTVTSGDLYAAASYCTDYRAIFADLERERSAGRLETYFEFLRGLVAADEQPSSRLF